MPTNNNKFFNHLFLKINGIIIVIRKNIIFKTCIMKKKIFTSFIFCFFISAVSFDTLAQEYRYDISKYYTPDIVRNSLDLNFNSSGGLSNTATTYYSPIYQGVPNDSLKTSNVNGQLYSTFSHNKNTRKLISSINLTGIFSLSSNTDNPSNEVNKEHRSNSSNNLNFNTSNRHYYSSNHFISYGASSFFTYNISKDVTGNKSVFTNRYQNDLNIGLNPYIGIGIGRIEQVEDARQAIYILEELSKKGVLTRQLTNDEIFNLSQQISRVKNKRFLDSRIHLMEEIASVDSFFVRNSLLNKEDATYFTNLYDLWINGANFSRKSGQSFEISFIPSGSLDKSKDEYLSSTQNETFQNNKQNWGYGGNLNLIYNYEKPVYLNWQHSVTVSMNGSTGYINEKDLQSTILNKNSTSGIGLNGSYTLGYYPTTRTNLSVGISEIFNQNYSKPDISSIFDSVGWIKSHNSTTRIIFSAYYYLSRQLRLSGYASLNKYLYKSDYGSINNFNAGFSAGLSYSFF